MPQFMDVRRQVSRLSCFYTIYNCHSSEACSGAENIIMEIECPKCGNSEETYFDGCTYVCENCGNRWGDDDNIFNDTEEDY